MDTDRLAPTIVPPDTAPAYWNRGALWTALLSAHDTQGQITVLEQLMPGGDGPPQHIHERAAEGFYILDGELELTIAGETTRAGAGAAVWIPAGTPHAFNIVSPEARVLNLYVPGGFDDRLPFLATPAQARTLPPPGFRDAVAPEAADAYAARLRDLHEETPVDGWVEPGQG